MVCHIKRLSFVSTFTAKGGAEHKRYLCRECGQRWQWSPLSGYYQTGPKRKPDAKTETIHKRVTKAEKRAVDRGELEIVLMPRENS